MRFKITKYFCIGRNSNMGKTNFREMTSSLFQVVIRISGKGRRREEKEESKLLREEEEKIEGNGRQLNKEGRLAR